MSQIEADTLFGGTYKDLRVLVTGHTGFKGSWLTLWLEHLGAQVLGISIDDCGPGSHFRQLKQGFESVIGDIRNKDLVVDTFKSFQPQVVFHLAAQPLVRASYKDPSFTYETNVIGTLNILEAARISGSVNALVNITTDKVYENLEQEIDYREGDRLGGYDPYSSSKACAEILTSSYRRSFFPNHEICIATARAGNVIGGGDWSGDRLIPDLIRAAKAGELTEIRSPQATRPWQHVLDPLSGYLMLGQKLWERQADFCGPWNFGPAKSANIQVIQVLNLMEKQWDKIAYYINEEEAKKFHEAKLLMLDCQKANVQLGWTPTWEIETVISETSKWYKAFCESNSLLSQTQLEAYIQEAYEKGQAWAVHKKAVGFLG